VPEGIICLLSVLADTNSVSSTASSWEGFRTLPVRVLGNLKLSLDECTEFIILGFITMLVQEMLSFLILKSSETFSYNIYNSSNNKKQP